MVDLETLSRAPLIGDLSLDAQRVLATTAVVRRYATGAVLWRAGDRVTSLAIVLEGRVRVVREGRGRQHVLHTEGPGGTLGEVPLFTGAPAPATALAPDMTHAGRRCRPCAKRALAVRFPLKAPRRARWGRRRTATA
jgi:hypothetical protein